MTLLGKVGLDVHLNAPAEKFHEMVSINPHLIANITPAKVKGVSKHQGDWGKVGSIIVWNYVHDGKTCVTKSVIEAIDAEKKSITWRVIEGDLLDEQHKTFKLISEIIPKEKGSVAHLTCEYEKLHSQVPDPHSLIQLVTAVTKEIDSHLTQGLHHEEQLLGKVLAEVHVEASAQKFYEMLTITPHLIPNICSKLQRASPDSNWGKLGSVITLHYVLEGKNNVVKNVIHAIDRNTNLLTLRAVEGDLLKEFKSMYLTMQAIPKEKGSVVRITMEYEKLNAHIPDPFTLLQLATDIMRDIGSHLAQ